MFIVCPANKQIVSCAELSAPVFPALSTTMAPNDEGSQSGKEASAAVRISDDSEGLPSVGAFPLFRHTLNEKQQLLESLGAADSTNDSQSFQELLLARVPSYIYGEWYHNAAALLLTASFAFLASKLGLGLGVVLLACIALGTWYKNQCKWHKNGYTEREKLFPFSGA